MGNLCCAHPERKPDPWFEEREGMVLKIKQLEEGKEQEDSMREKERMYLKLKIAELEKRMEPDLLQDLNIEAIRDQLEQLIVAIGENAYASHMAQQILHDTADVEGYITRMQDHYKHSILQLEHQLSLHKDWKIYQIMRNIIKISLRQVTEDVTLAIDRWRENILPTPSITPPPMPVEEDQICITEIDYEEDVDSQDLEEAQKILTKEKQERLQQNVLMTEYKSAKVSPGKLLPKTHAFRLLEEVLDKKFEVDQQDLASGRKPRSMTEFLMEHLTRTFGLKALAKQQISKLIPTLQSLYKQQHPYGIFFCRLFQLFHEDPVPLGLALVVIKARMEFQKLVAARFERPGAKQRGSKRKDSGADKVNYGGTANLVDVGSFVYQMFEHDKFCRALMLRLLKPESISLEDYLQFRICHKMAKMGQTPDGIFTKMDVDGNGTIDRMELLAGIRNVMDLSLPADDVDILFNALDSDGSGDIDRGEFSKIFSLNKYMEQCKSSQFVTTKCTFLNVLLEVHRIAEQRDMTYLTSLFRQNQPMDYSHFQQLLHIYEPTISNETISSLFEEASQEDEVLNLENFCKVLIQYNMCTKSLKDFCK